MFKETIRLKPLDYKQYFNFAIAKFYLGELDESLQYFDSALDANKTFYELFFYKGIIYMKTKRYEAAVDSFSTMLGYDPHHADSQFNKAYCLDMLNRRDEAI